METLRDEESQLKRKDSIQKIKKYLESILLEKHKRSTKKILDPTRKELSDVLEQDVLDNEDEIEVTETQWDGEWLDDMETWETEQKPEEEQKQEFDIPPEDRDEYIPRDSEFWEALWEESRFAEVYPPFLWYYVQWKKSYFDRFFLIFCA